MTPHGGNLRQSLDLFRHFLVAYPGRSILMLVALTAAALAEGVGIAAPATGDQPRDRKRRCGGAVSLQVERVFALVGLDHRLARCCR